MSLPWLNLELKLSNGGQMNKTIIIAGDSWGCGEWDTVNGSYTVVHDGLSKYIGDQGYNVINLCQPGGTNLISAELIENFLLTNQSLDITNIIIFQTEWYRDFRVMPNDELLEHISFGYVACKNRIISSFYYRLSRTSTKYQIPIHVIGGCSDTIWLDQFTIEYPGLDIACQSLTNLAINNDHKISNPVYSLMVSLPEIELLKQHLSDNDVELLITDIDHGEQRYQIWSDYPEFFWPDNNHANRNTHKILFEFLKKQIPNL